MCRRRHDAVDQPPGERLGGANRRAGEQQLHRPLAADVARDADLGASIDMLMIICDGVWWRRAVDPKFDVEAVMPMFFDITRYMLLDRGAGRKDRDSASKPGEKS